jgi:NADH-quinone oxidoreductase subunit G
MYEMLLPWDGGSMSEKIENRGKSITVTIDGKVCTGVYGETILQIARKNDIYIPTMCYLSKVSPIASCRMCAVKVQGVEGNILSCQEKAVNGAVITTNNEELTKHRTNIMKLYDVNHPLQCGVCDKSGECDLQNKTLEFKIDSQEFAAKDESRKQKKWGVLGYDPHLCIMCEKCVHTCNEVIGTAALYIKPGGYKSTIDIKMSRCEQCGDCISVCPVGALVSNPYKYSSNAWESSQVPATCAHCSTGCPLIYDVKYGTTITRVKNDFEFSTLCGAGRFGFGFENKKTSKSPEDFIAAVNALKTCNSIKFNSYITNEEAMILQQLKEKLGIKLINEDAYNYKKFLTTYNSMVGRNLYSATNQTVASSDGIIIIGTRISRDNPGVKYNINIATKKQRAEFIYMHPVDDIALSNKYTQFIKYEVGSEEAILAMLCKVFLTNTSDSIKQYFEDLDIGYLSGESSVGEEEFDLIKTKFIRKKQKTIIVGTDIYGHKNAQNIAKLIGLLEKYGDFKVLAMPPHTNSLGVALICDLDEKIEGKVVGYNELGDYVISSCGSGNFNTPALNQQEGTFASIDLKVVNTNAALLFDGYCLNDLANEILDEKQKYTIDYTESFGKIKEFSSIKFDDLKNGFDKYGNDLRGYFLNKFELETNDEIPDEIEELETYNGSVIYRCEPLHQFNKATAKSLLLQSDTHLRGSAAFATSAKIKAGDMVNIMYGDQIRTKMFKVDTSIKGTIAFYPTFDDGLSDDLVLLGYRFKRVKIEKVDVR